MYMRSCGQSMMPSLPNSCDMLPALIVNGQRQPQSPAKPADILLQHLKGPYTTAHVTAGLCAEAWQQHMVRLARAVLRLHQWDAGSFQRVINALQDGEDPELQLQKLLDARLRAELAVLSAADDVPMAVTILVCDPPASSKRTGRWMSSSTQWRCRRRRQCHQMWRQKWSGPVAGCRK